MATYKETTLQWKTTIIVSTSLQNHDISRMLSAQQHRIRFSDSIGSGAVVFPLSGTAFLLVDPEDLPEHFEESGLTERIKAFVQVHRNSFLLLYAPFNGKREMEILSVIQHRSSTSDTLSRQPEINANLKCQFLMIGRFFGSNLRILPVRNNAEIVKGMLIIAKATSKPHLDSICDRMALARAHIIESSPVWEMLRDIL